jgi:hypothetical protein
MQSALLHTCTVLFALASLGGIRGPGNYCGAVLFDRWDGCYLYSGTYVMYVAHAAREQLRAHAGQWVQVDATDVWQPNNPGDGRINRFRVIGRAPADRNWVPIDGLVLRVTPAFDDGPTLRVEVRNAGRHELRFLSGEFSITLLARRVEATDRQHPSDGPSYAMVTRQSFATGEEPRKGGQNWSVDEPLPRRFELGAGETVERVVSLDLPPGEYEVVFGYGGGVHQGRGVMSNRIAFDLHPDGSARPATQPADR